MPEIEPFGWQGVPVILEEVANSFGLVVVDLTGTSRMKTTTLARYVAAFLIRELCQLSWPELGQLFERHHASVIAGVKTIELRMREEEVFLQYIAYIKSKFTYSGKTNKKVLSDLKERYGND